MQLWEAIFPLAAGVWLLVLANRKDPNATREQLKSGEGTPRQRRCERFGWCVIACTAIYCLSVNLSAKALEPPPWSIVEQPGEFAVDMPDNRSAEEETIDLGFGDVYSPKWHGPVGEGGHVLIRYVAFRKGKAPPQTLQLVTSEVCQRLRAKKLTIAHTQMRPVRNCPGAIIEATSAAGRSRSMVVITSKRAYVLTATKLTPEMEKRFFDSFRLLIADETKGS